MKRQILPAVLVAFMFIYPGLDAVAQAPVIGGYNVYYGHLHNHTAFSDGSGTPEQAYDYARNTAHLDFFGLSDHSEMLTGDEYTATKNAANVFNENGKFAAFYGFEWSSVFNGHVTVVNTADYCSYTSPVADNFTKLLSWVNAGSGIAFFNHPGWLWLAFQEFNHFADFPSDKFVGMELWNDVDGFYKYYYNDGYFGNDGNKGYFDEALVRGWKIGASGSDDNHTATWGTRTPWRMGVLANALSRQSITEALIARRFFSTMDGNLSLSFRINGAQMGAATTGGTLDIEILAGDPDANDAFSKVVIVKNGAVAETININPTLNPLTIKRILSGANNDYFYIKVTQADGDEAISSPVFIEGMANVAPVVAIVSPLNNDEFSVGETVSILAEATDADGTVNTVEFYAGETKIGEDMVAPYACLWPDAAAGTYELTAKATDNLGAFTVSDPVLVTISAVVPPAFCKVESRIDRTSDDAEQYSKGTVVLSDPVLNIVYESKTTGNQIIGLRYNGITVPQGATITKAYIQFTGAAVSSGSSSLGIKGEASDNAATFTTKSKNISARKKTVAGASWTPDQWSAGAGIQSPDIKTVVQEIVNRTGWKSGNSLVMIITGTGTRTAWAFDGNPGTASLICIEYTPAKSGIIADKNAWNPGGKVAISKTILVYPNPVQHILNVKTDGIDQVEQLQVYSVTGSLVRQVKVEQGYNEIQVECGNLDPGTYLLKINNSEGSWSTRFIKQ